MQNGIFNRSDKIDELVQTKDDDALSNICATESSMGYDSDGITCLEILECGFKLALEANGRDIWISEYWDDDQGGNRAYFFIGSEEEVVKAIEVLPDMEESEEEDDEIPFKDSAISKSIEEKPERIQKALDINIEEWFYQDVWDGPKDKL
jgi:hypothetical protein